MIWNFVFKYVSIIVFTIFFNEYLLFYIKIGLTCSWPCGREKECSEDDLNVFMVADTHILGRFRGHWLDKIKREWQMYRSFQSSLIFNPDAVFFLGDLMDEGQWTDKPLFEDYSQQFRSLFNTGSTKIPTIVVPGNHDLGFHAERHPLRDQWFQTQFNRSAVDLIQLKGFPFVLVNSMAMHGDGCQLCRSAVKSINNISDLLDCAKDSSCVDRQEETQKLKPYHRPIILMHFPLYRKDEQECLRDSDFDLTAKGREDNYRDKWDALSMESSTFLLNKLNPRAVFNGHAHRGCTKKWADPADFWEYTVNSYSWRNGDKPTFLMVTINNQC